MWTIYPLTITAAAGTSPTAPSSAAWPLPLSWLEQVYIDIPVGQNGNCGIRLLYHGQQVFPFSNLAFAVLTPQMFAFPWKDQIDASGFTVQAYSVGKYSHLFMLYAECDPSHVFGNPSIMAPGADDSSFGYDASSLSGLSYTADTSLPITATAPPKAPAKPKEPVKKKEPPKKKEPAHKVAGGGKAPAKHPAPVKGKK
jgi:hypothetical protein